MRHASIVGSWIASEIKEVAKDIRWLVTRERGWVRRGSRDGERRG
jgi:hypothetical protein